jgi:hypothetical protein
MKYFFLIIAVSLGLPSLAIAELSQEEALICSWAMRGVTSANFRSQPLSRVLATNLKNSQDEGNHARVYASVYNGTRGDGVELCTGEICFHHESGRIIEMTLQPKSQLSPQNPYSDADLKTYAIEAALSLHVTYRLDATPNLAAERATYEGEGHNGGIYVVTIRDGDEHYRYEIEFVRHREFPIYRIRALS